MEIEMIYSDNDKEYVCCYCGVVLGEYPDGITWEDDFEVDCICPTCWDTYYSNTKN